MIYRAYPSLTQRLLALSETGMGYQVIDARKVLGTLIRNRFVVYNSELLIDLDAEFEARKRQIINEGYTSILRNATLLDLPEISLIKKSAIVEIRTLSEGIRDTKGRHAGGKGAVDNPKFSADGISKYVRLSAYENDKRVDFEKKRFIPGTYATTELDYAKCKRYNDDPVDRYALPNNEDIKWAFDVKPKTSDTLQQGIAQPAFGHYGGGEEVFFEYGTSEGTLIGKHPY